MRAPVSHPHPLLPVRGWPQVIDDAPAGGLCFPREFAFGVEDRLRLAAISASSVTMSVSEEVDVA
jgi:hypothetical protein